MSGGNVYILSNPSFRDGYLKTGKTAGASEARARCLQGTGVPTPFKVEHSVRVEDCGLVEAVMHDRLAQQRVAWNREFFEVSVAQAIAMLDEVATASRDRGCAKELQSKWAADVNAVSERNPEAAFEMRLARCAPVIADAIEDLRTVVLAWDGVSTRFHHEGHGIKFYVTGTGLNFFELHPKHSADQPKIGVAFHGIPRERVSEAGLEDRDLAQAGEWTHIYDSGQNAVVLRLARAAYEARLAGRRI